MVSLARPFLADPAWVARPPPTAADEINTCIGCNQACLDHTFAHKTVSCLVNPRAAHETELTLAAAPAGQARRRRRRRSGRPRCRDRRRRNADTTSTCSRPSPTRRPVPARPRIPGKEEFAETLRYFMRRLEIPGVELRLSHRVAADELARRRMGRDRRRHRRDAADGDIAGTDRPDVHSYADVITGAVDVGRRVAVIGAGGIGFDVAEFLTADRAPEFGAEGIGLCRTEHMFFEETRIRTVREMILAEDEQARRAALSKLLPMQRADFVELFEIMKGLPVTIRLLDPPLHEFLPHTQAEIEEVARAMNTDPRRLADRARDLREFNPMLGFRGCRLAIAYPEIAEMQARAIFEAAVEAEKAHRQGRRPGGDGAADRDQGRVRSGQGAGSTPPRKSVMKETGIKLSYQVGTMIELPRACLMAGDIAETAEFFSFGTNDLTQTTYGISRDDAAGFLGTYIAKGILRDRSVHLGRSRRRRRTGQDRRRARPQDPPRSEGRHLRRAWRRSRLGRVLPRDRARLRLVLALPRADRAAGRGTGRARQGGRPARRESSCSHCVRSRCKLGMRASGNRLRQLLLHHFC